jgi:hypothetical protein
MRIARLLMTSFLVASTAWADAEDATSPTPETPARYGIKQSAPDLGTHIRKDVFRPGSLPLNRSYRELTLEQQQAFKSQYEAMPLDDEPPFPVNGLQAVYQPIVKAIERGVLQESRGPLAMDVEVDEQGKATSVQVFSSPDKTTTQLVASVLMFIPYKPAICQGKPCKMGFPVRLQFDRR